MTDRVEQLLDDILAGPAALERLVAAYDRPRSPVELARAAATARSARPRFVFAGLGSSRFAALLATSDLRGSGQAAWTEYASSATPTVPAEDLVFIAISASGRTAEVVAAARRHRGRSLVVGITNDPDSALADEADHVLPLHAGFEAAGIATRTFRATVAVLSLFAGHPVAGLAPAIADFRAAVEDRGRWLPDMADALDGADAIDVLADASILGLAEQAALMLREAPRLPATTYDTGDWLHTGIYLALPGHRAVLFPGSAADGEVIATVERRGGRVVRVPAPPAADPLRRAITQSVMAELLAAELWQRTSAVQR